MNSSPASSYAPAELFDPVGEPRRDLAHPVLVDLDAGVLHVRQHLASGSDPW
jgi:hypothetical protein